MKNEKKNKKIKWYQSVKLIFKDYYIKRNDELEKLTNIQFKIINTYKDELDEKNKAIENLENIIISLNEDLENIRETFIIEMNQNKKKENG